MRIVIQLKRFKIKHRSRKTSLLEESQASDTHPALSVLKPGISKQKSSETQSQQEMLKVSDESGCINMDEILCGALDKSLLRRAFAKL